MDVTTLNDILHVDIEERVVSVEGHVTMQALCEHLVETYGMIIPVVPEMSKFTVAGLANGGGIQSSCHKYGLMWCTFESYVGREEMKGNKDKDRQREKREREREREALKPPGTHKYSIVCSV